MSYHVPIPRRVTARPRQRSQPAVPYPLYPLSTAQRVPPEVPLVPLASAPLPPQPKGKQLLFGVGMVVALLLLLWWLNQRDSPARRDDDEGDGLEANIRELERVAARKRSTAQMAKDLYERLDRRGGVNETTMRSLAQIAKKA